MSGGHKPKGGEVVPVACPPDAVYNHSAEPGADATAVEVRRVPADPVGLFIIGFLLNAAWCIGWALFLLWFERMRGA